MPGGEYTRQFPLVDLVMAKHMCSADRCRYVPIPDFFLFPAGLIPPKTDKRYDDTIRYCIVAAKKAIQQAGISKANAQAPA